MANRKKPKTRIVLGSEAPTIFSWDTSTHRFRNTVSGVFVSRVETRRILDAIVDKSADRLKTLTRSLQYGDITLAQWQASMASEIKSLHIVFAATARGGWNNMTVNNWNDVTEALYEQYGYLRDFAEQVYTGQQRNDGTMLVRSTLYAESARVTYERERRELETEAGAEEERNLLGASDHCADCIDATTSGWVPINTLTPIGYRACVSKCRCFMIYRKGSADTIGSNINE